MSLVVKSVARYGQMRPTLTALLPMFFALTGVHLSHISKTSVIHPRGLSSTFRSLLSFVSHPYMLFKRISSRLEADGPVVRSLKVQRLDGQKYWNSAVRNQRLLHHNVARPVDVLESERAKDVKFITYYKPQLLPPYREAKHSDGDALELVISPKIFMFWHSLVYPHKAQPNTSRASQLLEFYSTRDRREILRITQLAKKRIGDISPFDRTYRNMWRDYWKNKGPDIVVSFSL